MSQNGYGKLQKLLRAGCKISHLHMSPPEAKDTCVILTNPNGGREVVVAIDDQDGVKIMRRAIKEYKNPNLVPLFS